MDAAQTLTFGTDGEMPLLLPPRPAPADRRARAGHPVRSRAAVAASGLFSLTLHAAAALAILTWGRNELGVFAMPTEAISLELAASPVVEQADIAPLQTESSAASVAQKVGSDVDRAQAVAEGKPEDAPTPDAVSEPVQAPTPLQAQPSSLQAQPDPVSAVNAEAAVSLPPPAQRPTRKDTKPDKHPKRPQETPQQNDAKASLKGGVASRSNAGAAKGAGRVSASAGDISGYAARVRARVAGNRPSGRGGNGTATVTFGVSRSGGLTYVRLGRSSGVPALDQAAVAAVRRSAPFPPPPAGTPASRLVMTVPFYFR